jgi:hydroxyacylglutathione hydrolase
MDSLIALSALGDNFIYLYSYEQGTAFVVDPGQSDCVLKALADNGLNLDAILLTHSHYDHTGGAAELKKRTGASVIGPTGSVDRLVSEGDVIEFGKEKITVIATPGHTASSVCYYLEPSESIQNGIVWTGDTLFVGGCGRLMGSSAKVMYESLCRLAQFPDETIVCCGHDYTVENYQFALTVEPDNKLIPELLEKARRTEPQERGISTISQEKKANLFLRTDSKQIRKALNMPNATAIEVFAELRRRKDHF